MKIGDVEGVWARNLLANRIYEAPVIFLEPYIANSEAVYQRIQMGDFDGQKKIGNQMKTSLIREYAEAVVLGLEKASNKKINLVTRKDWLRPFFWSFQCWPQLRP